MVALPRPLSDPSGRVYEPRKHPAAGSALDPRRKRKGVGATTLLARPEAPRCSAFARWVRLRRNALELSRGRHEGETSGRSRTCTGEEPSALRRALGEEETRRGAASGRLGLFFFLAGCVPVQELSSYSEGQRFLAADAGGDRILVSPPRPDGSVLGGEGAAPTDSGSGEPNRREEPAVLAPAPATGAAGPDAGTEPPADLPDEEAPRIEAVSPADQAVGVPSDSPIVVAFSESMDTAQVELAFESDDIDPSRASFVWSEGDRVLTITPGEPLQYARGPKSEAPQPRSYAYQFSAIARDLAGNRMEPRAFSFLTLRAVTLGIAPESDDARTGNWTSAGVFGTGSCGEGNARICMGDGALLSDAQYKAFASFDLAPLERDAPVLEAELTVGELSTLGQPFGALGELRFEEVEFSTIGDAAFRDARGRTVAPLQSTTALLEPIEVLDTVARKLAEGGPAQFRWSFAIGTDGDALADLVIMEQSSFELTVTQLIP